LETATTDGAGLEISNIQFEKLITGGVGLRKKVLQFKKVTTDGAENSVGDFYLAYSVSTFSTTCLPKLQTLVEHWITMFSELSYLKKTD
jgi:hypothetical protein